MASRTLDIRTAAAHVYEDLRDRIILGELAPLTPLPLNELAAELGVSTMPVRAALGRLEGDSLVVQIPHHGASVAPLELEDLEEIQAVRAGIEGFAARLGAKRLEETDLERMRTLLRGLESQEASLESYSTAQRELHDVCYAVTGRWRLLELIGDYQRRAERYLRLALGSHAGIEGSMLHQQRFVEACERRSGDETEQVIRDALNWTVTTLAPLIHEQQMAEAPSGPECKAH